MFRTLLQAGSGIGTTYFNASGSRLDLSHLSNSCWLTPDCIEALLQLQHNITAVGGKLYVSDAFRGWDLQSKAYDDWKQGHRKDFAAPPGQSFHGAGRAVDIDVYSLEFNNNKSTWLDKLWSIAIPLGWHPIVGEPDMSLSECWHFQYPGNDWHDMARTAPDSLVAQCATLDVGKWNPQEDPSKLQILFLQSQLNRVQAHTDGPYLILDGILGTHTRRTIDDLLGTSWTVESAIEKVIKL